MFEKIIVPLDPAKKLEAAKEYGLDLARHFGSTIVGVYIIAPVKTGFGATSVNTDMFMVPAGERELRGFTELADDRGLESRGYVAHGYREQALSSALCQGQGDTLVLGSFRSHLTRLFTGSEDERIVDACDHPLFVVRHQAPIPRPGQTLLVPFDGAAFRKGEVMALTAVAHRFQAKLHLLHFTLKDHRTVDVILQDSKAALGEDLVVGAESVKHRHYQHYGPLVDQASLTVKSPLIVLPVLKWSHTVSYKLLHDLILNIHVPLCLLRGRGRDYRPADEPEAPAPPAMPAIPAPTLATPTTPTTPTPVNEKETI